MKNTRKHGKVNAKLLGILLFIITTIAFTSCENFMQGAELQNELSRIIEEAGKKEVQVEIKINPKEGISSPSGIATWKERTIYSIAFSETDNYKFDHWECSSTKVEIADKTSTTTTVKIPAYEEGIVITPVCLERPKVNSFTPEYNPDGESRDQPIIVQFSKAVSLESFRFKEEELVEMELASLNEEGIFTLAEGVTIKRDAKELIYSYEKENKAYFKNIEIVSDIDSLVQYYKAPYFEGEENKVLKIELEPSKQIPVNAGETKSVKITLSGEIFDATESKVTLGKAVEKNLKLNSETNRKEKLTVKANAAGEGSFSINIDDKYSIGKTFEITFTPDSAYQFLYWKADTEAVLLSDVENEKLTITVKDTTENGTTVIPVCAPKLTVSCSIEGTTVPKDSDIILTFSKPVSIENDLSKIQISSSGININTLYTGRSINENMVLIKNTEWLEINKGATKEVTVVVPENFFYVEGNKKVTVNEEKSFSFKFDSTTRKKTNVQFIVDEEKQSTNAQIKVNTEAVNSGSIKNFSMKEEVQIAYPLQNGYFFTGWTVSPVLTGCKVESYTNRETGVETINVKRISDNVVVFSLETIEGKREQAKLICYDQITDGSDGFGVKVSGGDVNELTCTITPEFNSEGIPYYTPIIINFNMPVKERDVTDYTKIKVTDIREEDKSYLYKVPELSADGKKVTLYPNLQNLRAEIISKGTIDISVCVSESIRSKNVELLTLLSEKTERFKLIFSKDTENPILKKFEIINPQLTGDNVLISDEDLSILDANEENKSKFQQNHIKDNVKLTCTATDDVSGVKSLVIKETHLKDNCELAVTSKTFITEIDFTYEADTNEYLLDGGSPFTYKLKTTEDGLIKLEFTVKDFDEHSSETKTYYVVNDTTINTKKLDIQIRGNEATVKSGSSKIPELLGNGKIISRVIEIGTVSDLNTKMGEKWKERWYGEYEDENTSYSLSAKYGESIIPLTITDDEKQETAEIPDIIKDKSFVLLYTVTDSFGNTNTSNRSVPGVSRINSYRISSKGILTYFMGIDPIGEDKPQNIYIYVVYRKPNESTDPVHGTMQQSSALFVDETTNGMYVDLQIVYVYFNEYTQKYELICGNGTGPLFIPYNTPPSGLNVPDYNVTPIRTDYDYTNTGLCGAQFEFGDGYELDTTNYDYYLIETNTEKNRITQVTMNKQLIDLSCRSTSTDVSKVNVCLRMVDKKNYPTIDQFGEKEKTVTVPAQFMTSKPNLNFVKIKFNDRNINTDMATDNSFVVLRFRDGYGDLINASKENAFSEKMTARIDYKLVPWKEAFIGLYQERVINDADIILSPIHISHFDSGIYMKEEKEIGSKLFLKDVEENTDYLLYGKVYDSYGNYYEGSIDWLYRDSIDEEISYSYENRNRIISIPAIPEASSILFEIFPYLESEQTWTVEESKGYASINVTSDIAKKGFNWNDSSIYNFSNDSFCKISALITRRVKHNGAYPYAEKAAAYPIYVMPTKPECNLKVLEDTGAGITIKTDNKAIVQTICSAKNRGTDPRKWERIGLVTNEKLISEGIQNYVVDTTKMEPNDYYVVVVHYADGTTAMSSVHQL